MLAFQNALYQLKHCASLDEGVVDTIGRGGDTDTNAAICGALQSAVAGRQQIPEQWESSVLNCRADVADKRVKNPRLKVFWPVDAMELVDGLLE